MPKAVYFVIYIDGRGTPEHLWGPMEFDDACQLAISEARRVGVSEEDIYANIVYLQKQGHKCGLPGCNFDDDTSEPTGGVWVKRRMLPPKKDDYHD